MALARNRRVRSHARHRTQSIRTEDALEAKARELERLIGDDHHSRSEVTSLLRKDKASPPKIVRLANGHRLGAC